MNSKNELKNAALRKFEDACNVPTGCNGLTSFEEGFDAGYDAHESAIRTAAEALVGVMEKLFNGEDGIIYGEDDIKAEFDALKAALATGKKEMEPVEHRTYCKHSYENGIDCPVCQGVPRLSDNSVEVSNIRSKE